MDEHADDDWAPAVTTPEARHARELMDLLADAGIPARLATVPTGGGGGIHAGTGFTVLVPEAEVPVAVGVAERCLPWFAGDAAGGLSDAECIAALDEPHDDEFAARLDLERQRRTAGLRMGRALLVLAAVAAALWAAGAFGRG